MLLNHSYLCKTSQFLLLLRFLYKIAYFNKNSCPHQPWLIRKEKKKKRKTARHITEKLERAISSVPKILLWQKIY